ncbi:molybdate transport system regulatory protein [Paracidovorax wautersii]|uniref:Molybdate transport system regulatory protein n=2 Tax=Paracidovorax wautersii TaxID=1177982 RepID=A0ABU1IGM0_9BURK|nr:molybdate transport system regulatory protein [Paracidovorax wautersii]
MMAPMQQRVSFSDALSHGQADRRIDILRRIGVDGSISQAARAVGVSYKAAWQALDTLTNLAGVPLVERAVGGVGGGGTQLTAAGRQLLDAADAMAQARRSVFDGLEATGGPGAAAARLTVRTSMRNQWPCVVESLERLGPLVRVHLRGALQQGAGTGLAVCARITRESAELLALRRGVPVLALCKATAVRAAVLPAASAVAAPSLPNQWSGAITRVARGPLEHEVSAQLDAGVQIVGFARAAQALRVRGRVLLSVDESAVVLAAID